MNILVTAIGSFSADCVISTLRAAGHKVIGCDIYPAEWHAVSKDCSATYRVPLATTGVEYIKALLDICRKEAICALFPLTDVEIDVLNKYRDDFARVGVNVCLQKEDTLHVARDKYALCCLFQNDASVDIPKFALAADVEKDFPFPAIAKPVDGRSSEGLHVIATYGDFLRMKLPPGYLLQQNIPGNVFTVDYVRNEMSGADVAIPREELLRTKNGAGTTIRITPCTHLINTVSYIGNVLHINGCVNMEFIFHKGKYYLIDINPRFSAGVAFSRMAGYDMVSAHLACFINSQIDEAPCLKDCIITKRYKEEILTRDSH